MAPHSAPYDAFSIWGFAGNTPLVGLPTGYVSNTAISSSMVLAGETIAGMTLMPGTSTFATPGDTIILNISAVPEPSTWATMLAGGLFAGFLGRRRANQGSASRAQFVRTRSSDGRAMRGFSLPACVEKTSPSLSIFLAPIRQDREQDILPPLALTTSSKGSAR